MNLNVFLNSKWLKLLIAKVIGHEMCKKAGVKAFFNINGLKINDDDEGVKIHIDADINMSKTEFEKMITKLM